jgi:phage gp46-like protein
MDAYSGDPKIKAEGMTWLLGQPEMDSGLWTSLYLSLETVKGWWGNPAAGSDLEALDDETLTNATRLEYITRARAALQWLIDDGIASDVAVEAEIQGPGRLAVTITVTEPDGTASTYRYAETWRATEGGL